MATDGSTKKTIIKFDVDVSQAIRNIQDIQKRMENLQKFQKALADSGQKNSEVYIKNNAVLKQYKEIIKANEKEIENAIKSSQRQEESLNSMRAKLRNLINDYSDLSKAERDGAKGDEMRQKIQELTGQVSELEQEIGDFTRSVGNYKSAVDAIPGPVGKALSVFKNLSGGTMSLSKAFKGGVTAVKAFGTQLLKLLANPIVAIIAAIALAVTKLVDAFHKSDDATTRLQQAFAQFQPILNVVNKAFEWLAEKTADVAYGIAKVATSVLNLIPAYRKAAEAAEELVTEQDKIEDAEREYIVNSAKRNRQIEQNNDKIADKQNHTAEERIELLKENAELERQDAKEAADNAKRKYEATKKEMEQKRRMSDEDKKILAELEAAAINADTEFYKADKSIQKKLSANIKEIENEAKEAEAAAKERAKIWKEYRENQISEERALQDTILNAVAESIEKEVILLKTNYSRQIEDLRKKLRDKDSKLTVQARKAVNSQIILLEAEMQLKIGDLREKNRREELAKEIDSQIKAKQLELDTKIKGSEDYYAAETKLRETQFKKEQKDYERQMDELNDKRKDIAITMGDPEKVKRSAKAMQMSVEEYYIFLSNENIRISKEIEATQKERALSEQKYNKDSEERERNHQQELRKIREKTAETDFDNSIQKRLNEIELYEFANKEYLKSKIVEEQMKHRLQLAMDENETLKNLSEEDQIELFGNVEAYNLAIAESNGKLIESENNYAEAVKATSAQLNKMKSDQIENYLKIGDAIAGVMGSLSSMFNELAEDNEAFQKYSKAAAITEAIISGLIASVQAIATATRSSATWVDMLVAIATVTATVGSVVGTIVSQLKDTKVEKSPKFATGGFVATGPDGIDKVDAKLTKGEYVIKKEKVDQYGKDFFDNLNFGNNNVPFTFKTHFAEGGFVMPDRQTIDYDMIRDIMAETMSEIQPVVSVKEISRVQNRVRIKENISRS